MAEAYNITAGSALVITVTIRDSSGVPVVGWDGSEALTTTVWPGGMLAPSFLPATTWVDPSAATIRITIDGADTANLETGEYQLLTRIDDGVSLLDAYTCTIDITSFAGMGVEPKVYGSYSDMLLFGRSWLKQLESADDDAGFSAQRARARSWLESIGQKRYQLWGHSDWLRQQFDADYLMVTDDIREAVAKYALYLICDGQLGTGEASKDYAILARMYKSQAETIATSLILEIDADQDGYPEITIDLSSTLPAFG